jgi:selenocysteine lyase/cysteine desulfurase
VTKFDLDFVRSQFPGLNNPDTAGWAFFENAGGSFPARQTIERLTDFYTRLKVQPYGPYPIATEGGALMDQARVRMAELLCVETEEVLFGPSTTANVYTLSHAFRGAMKEGDAVIVADQNHEANIGAWERLASTGVAVRIWEADPETGLLNLDDLDRLLDNRVKVVAFPHCSNIVAALNPVAEISKRARAAGAATVVDGVSHAPHGMPNVSELGCDIYLFSAYKTYGPHQGVMVARGNIAARLANQGHYFNANPAGKRLTPAGADHAQEAAMNGVADYFDALYDHHFPGDAGGVAKNAALYSLIRGQEAKVLAPLLDYVRSRNDIHLLGPSDPAIRVPTVAIACDKPGEELSEELAKHKIMCWGGDFYSLRLVEKMGAGHGALRLSFVHYTSPEEVDQAIKALDAVL